jgi:hypothetical protein
MVKYMKEKLDSILKPKDHSLRTRPISQSANKARKNIYYICMPLQLP